MKQSQILPKKLLVSNTLKVFIYNKHTLFREVPQFNHKEYLHAQVLSLKLYSVRNKKLHLSTSTV